jgi:DNA-binding response OmpR family regulator
MDRTGGKPVILVVDDDADHALMLELSLGVEGFEVRTAGSCAEARRELARGDVAVVVTDWTLGDGNALDVIATAKCPTIVLSGLELHEHRRAFDACFLKPTPPDRLAATIRGLRSTRGAVSAMRARAS